MSWSTEQVQMIIDYYRSTPLLFMVKHPDYFNKCKRSQAINNLILQLNRPVPTENDVKAKWNSVKTTYMAEKMSASDLGPLSCTETEQAWGKRKQKEIVEVIPVDELCHVPSRSTSVKPLPVVDEFFSLCLQAVPDSEAAVHLSKLRNSNVIMKTVRNEVLEAICHHAKTNNKYWKMVYELDIPSTMSIETLKKEEWCDERKFRITGSRCYSLYAYSKNNWAEKASKYFFDKPFAGNFATNYGVIQEKVSRNIYMAHLLEDENIVEVGLVVCQSDPWLACSPDGILMKNKRPHRLLEIVSNYWCY
ncbi:hypothetical protein FQR65_LT16822 [Abscondita terminalis]|nr:hypothetical protein FQR65_LT16822 [Abscondita terminalis]